MTIDLEAAAALDTAENEKWLSPISSWEAMLLAERGRIEFDRSPADWIRDHLVRTPIRLAPFDHEIVLQSRLIKLPHDDPADRFIAATARVYDFTLVTGDRRLLHKPDGYSVMKAI